MLEGIVAFFKSLAYGLGLLKDRQLMDAGKKSAQAQSAQDALARENIRDEVNDSVGGVDAAGELHSRWSRDD